MKKLAVLALALLIIFSSLAGCAKPAPVDFQIDSKNYFEIDVPSGSKVLLQADWYRVSTQDYVQDPKFNAWLYTVGEEAELTGMNTDQLEGATIYFKEHELSEYAHGEYYRNIFRQLSDLQGKTPEKNLFGDLRMRDVAKVRNALKGYVANAKVLLCYFTFDGAITKDIRIDTIKIASIDYEVAFDKFHITPHAIPEDRTEEIFGTHIEYGSSWAFGDSAMSQLDYCAIKGSAKSNIQDIRLEAVNDSCVVVDDTNYQEYAEYCGDYNANTMESRRTGSFGNGFQFYIEFAYLNFGKAREEFEKYDAMVSCLRYVITLEDGTELNSYFYHSSARAPQYELIHLLLNES